jgi:hypothetical protein
VSALSPISPAALKSFHQLRCKGGPPRLSEILNQSEIDALLAVLASEGALTMEQAMEQVAAEDAMRAAQVMPNWTPFEPSLSERFAQGHLQALAHIADTFCLAFGNLLSIHADCKVRVTLEDSQLFATEKVGAWLSLESEYALSLSNLHLVGSVISRLPLVADCSLGTAFYVHTDFIDRMGPGGAERLLQAVRSTMEAEFVALSAGSTQAQVEALSPPQVYLLTFSSRPGV